MALLASATLCLGMSVAPSFESFAASAGRANHSAGSHQAGSNQHSTYTSSDAERAWLTGDKAGKICETAVSDEQVVAARHSLGYSAATWMPARQKARQPMEAEWSALSYFQGEQGTRDPIEPLSGMARHPFTQLGCPFADSVTMASITDITFLVLANRCGGPPAQTASAPGARRNGHVERATNRNVELHAGGARNVFFDLGCSFYDDKSATNLTHGSAGGPSIPIFTALYRERCVEFDAIYAFEAGAKDQYEWWRNVPIEVRKVLHFFNVPVEEAPLGARWQTSLSNINNSFLRLLEVSVKPEDFVVLKIDIEGQAGGPELNIAHAIANSRHLAALVDEIFFEYHFWFDGLNFGWGLDHALKKQGNVDDALKLMLKLRNRGIRAHFWI